MTIANIVYRTTFIGIGKKNTNQLHHLTIIHTRDEGVLNVKAFYELLGDLLCLKDEFGLYIEKSVDYSLIQLSNAW